MTRTRVAENLKRRSISFTMNDDEKSLLDFICQYNGMTPSAYMRYLIIQEHRKVVTASNERKNQLAREKEFNCP